MFALWKKSCNKPEPHIKKQRHYFADKVPSSKARVFPVVMYGCESWTLKLNTEKLLLWTVVLERTLESPFDCKEIKLVNSKKINPEYSLERLMLKLKLQYSGHLMRRAKSLKRPWCWERLKKEEMGITEDEMVGWHPSKNEYEFEQALGDGGGQGRLSCCCPWDHKESDATKQLNNNNR